MNMKLERYYCKSCNSLFSDAKHIAYYTLNRFVDNQDCLIDGEHYRHGIVQPKYRANCPHCYSMHTLAVDDILTGKIVCRSEKIFESKDKTMLKYLGEMLKLHCEITGYLIVDNTLYNDNVRMKQKIIRLMCKKKKPLNRANDKYEGKVKE